MTNSDRLQEIRERAEKATAPPWEVDSEMHPAIESADDQLHIYDEGGHDYDDAIFIAKAREDIPWLLQHITEQQREIDRATDLCVMWCEEANGNGPDTCTFPHCSCSVEAGGESDTFEPSEEAKSYRKQERPM